MPIPDYQTLMLPLLKHVSDQREYKLNDVVDALSVEFNLTEEEKNELLPSGQTFLFGSRVGWARTYLKKAGLLESPKRATVVITERGLTILAQKPLRVDARLLR
ncbi:winged helix-turn-helix domain-containing protein [Fibrella sp. HMF5335]|uniref:Winged helix-turn-helix domain-containing protein n=1 Tax=Fibrella rubiginis TaxID=2817060 RepID=A0A939GL87_9BACT|nr:winged helix-turn-helix domain-containing protein [Fibrella rubiginis]MBO0938463.1 winged helix-turn-helix domain-containing protein [Fibrella rubiginis]